MWSAKSGRKLRAAVINSYLYTLLRGLYVAFIPIEPVPSNPVAIFWIFQILDGIVWILQIVAVSILWFEQEVATYLLFAAFIGQLLVYVTFLIVLARFHSRASKHRKAGTLASQTESTRGGSPPRSYKATVVTMYIVPFLLGVRAVYYLVNCGTPHYWFSGVVDPYWDHTYYRNTWWLKWWEPGQIGLDATPVFLALLVLAWPTANPGRTLKRKHRGPNLEAWRYGAQGPPAQQRVGGVDNWRYGAQGPAAAPQSYNGVETWRYGAQGPPEMQQRRLGDAELARELEMRNLRAVPREQTVSYHEAAEGAILEKEGGTHVTV